MKTENTSIREHHWLLIENPVKQVIELDSQVMVLGRDGSKNIVIESDLISREHATFFRIPTADPQKYDCQILDGGYQKERSKNGIFVNSVRCFSQRLKHGDILSFGEVIHGIYLKVELSTADLEIYRSRLLETSGIKENPGEIGEITRFFTTTSYLSEQDPTSIMLG